MGSYVGHVGPFKKIILGMFGGSEWNRKCSLPSYLGFRGLWGLGSLGFRGFGVWGVCLGFD